MFSDYSKVQTPSFNPTFTSFQDRKTVEIKATNVSLFTKKIPIVSFCYCSRESAEAALLKPDEAFNIILSELKCKVWNFFIHVNQLTW